MAQNAGPPRSVVYDQHSTAPAQPRSQRPSGVARRPGRSSSSHIDVLAGAEFFTVEVLKCTPIPSARISSTSVNCRATRGVAGERVQGDACRRPAGRAGRARTLSATRHARPGRRRSSHLGTSFRRCYHSERGVGHENSGRAADSARTTTVGITASPVHQNKQDFGDALHGGHFQGREDSARPAARLPGARRRGRPGTGAGGQKAPAMKPGSSRRDVTPATSTHGRDRLVASMQSSACSSANASSTLPGILARAGYPDTANSIPPATTDPAKSMAPPLPATTFTVLYSWAVSSFSCILATRREVY
jgi:hypothetical protein